jgi:hypothetical protein
MSDSPNPPIQEIRDQATLFTRARTTSVELARLVLTLATGTIGAISLEALHGQAFQGPHKPELTLIRIALISLVITVASALIGVAADSASDVSRGMALFKHEAEKAKHFHILSDRSLRFRNRLFITATISFITGIACAGIFILIRVA